MKKHTGEELAEVVERICKYNLLYFDSIEVLEVCVLLQTTALVAINQSRDFADVVLNGVKS